MSLNIVKCVTIVAMVAVLPSFSQAQEFTVTQHEKTFQMNGAKVASLTIKKGDSIKFLNEDPWFHNVFSLSDLKTFDLGSYPKGQSKTVTFDKSGEAEIECAIHPQMLLKLEVK